MRAGHRNPYKIPLVRSEATLDDHHRMQQMMQQHSPYVPIGADDDDEYEQGSNSRTPGVSNSNQMRGSCSRGCFWTLYIVMGIGAALGIGALILSVVVATNSVRTISGVGPSGGNVDAFGGTGISVTPNLPANRFEINNDGVLTVNSVSPVSNNILLTGLTGITMGTAGPSEVTIENTGVTMATGGTGISVSNGGVGNIVISNDGVLSITGDAMGSTAASGAVSVTGTGIEISTTAPSSMVITNTGVRSLIAGTGIDVDTATGDVTVSNTGVVTINGNAAISSNFLIAAGAGITVMNGMVGNEIIVTNNGVRSLTVSGDGLSVDQSTLDVTISNTGTTSIVAGTGITISETGMTSGTGAVTVNNDGVVSLTGDAGGSVAASGTIAVSGTGIEITTTANTMVIANQGILSASGGDGISVTGTDPLTIDHDRTSDSLLTHNDANGNSVRFTLDATSIKGANTWYNLISDGMAGNSATAVDGGLGKTSGVAAGVDGVALPSNGIYQVNAHCRFIITPGTDTSAPISVLMALGFAATDGGYTDDPTATRFVPPGGITSSTFVTGSAVSLSNVYVSLSTTVQVCPTCDITTASSVIGLHMQASTTTDAQIETAADSCEISLVQLI